MINRLIIVCLFFLNLQYFPSYAYEGEVHKTLNINAVNASNLDSIFKNQLGIDNGIIKSLDGFEDLFFNDGNKVDLVWEWIAFGGVAEDFGKHEGVIPSLALFDIVEVMSTRAHNHFHDPLKDWTNAGLNNIALNDIYNDEYGQDSVSTVVWGLNPGEQDFELNTTGDWSWGKAKESFYIYLTGNSNAGNTVANTESERNSYFAYSLRALGQVMHLLQDMSVPLHTRNDAHIFPLGKMKDYKTFWTYETYTAKNIDNLDYTFDIFDKPSQSLLLEPNPDPNYSSISPVSSLFDNNKYDGSTPFISMVGLAEYSNANFLTKDTMFSGFPFPKLSETIINLDTDNWRLYLENNGQGAYLQHLALVSYLGLFRNKFFPLIFTKYPLTLDDVCYAEYADHLIPRAVAYSAALLDYFFRGNIEISAPSGSVYSIIDGSISPQQFTSIKANIRNNTSQGTDIHGNTIYETMGEGDLIAVAKYKKRTDYEEDLSTDPPSALSREEYFSYSVSMPIEISSLDSSSATEFTFDFSGNPIPAGITDLYLQVIFKGTLGNEINNAIAVGMKDLNEPMHYTESNNDDRVYLDHVLRTADEIRANETLTARAVEGEIYSLIDPHNISTKIAFYSLNTTPTYYNVYYNSLAPGTYGRLILISDSGVFNIMIHRESNNPLVSYYNYYQVSGGVINQMVSDTEFHNTNISSFRGVIQHVFHGHVWYFPDNAGITTAPWPEMTGDPVAATTITP